MTRGRKALPAPQPPADTTDHEALEQAGEAATNMALLDEAVSAAQIEFSQFIGAHLGRRKQMAVIGKLLTCQQLLELGNLKSSRAYKGLKFAQADGKLLTVSTWPEFCELVIGRSHQQVDEDLRNYKAFGAELLEAMQDSGIGYREMRELRTLPADERTELLAAAEAGDKEAFLDLAEGLSDKHAREQAQATRRAEDLRKQLDARQRIVDGQQAELQAFKEADALKRAAPLPEQEQEQLDELRDAVLAAEGRLAYLLAVVDRVMTMPATEAAEVQARHSLDYLVQRVVDGCLERGISVDLAQRVAPIWVHEQERAIDAAHAELEAKKVARKAARANGKSVN